MAVVPLAAASLSLYALVAAGGAPAVAQETLPGYTFHMNVAMAMRHFPWLHFHLDGEGEYDPAQAYDVRFTSVPWFFPRKHNDIDLSMLDPVMWPGRYTYVETGQQGPYIVYELHALRNSAMRVATVAVGARGRARQLDVQYSDGTNIHMDVGCGDVDGFFLPTNLSASIDEPHLALSAKASFEDYVFTSS